MATRSIRNRLRKVEETKAEMDKPNKMTRLIYFEGEEIPYGGLPKPTLEEVHLYGPGGLPILIWDIPGYGSSKEADA